MKNNGLEYVFIVLAVIFSGSTLLAQDNKKEESRMIVKVLKDGKSVLDTTYIMDEGFNLEEINSLSEGKLKWIQKDGKEIIISDEVIFEELEEGKEGKILKKYIIKGDNGDEKSVSKVIVMKNIGEYEEDEGIETELELIMEDAKGLHKFHAKEGNVMFFGGEKAHKVHKGNVFIYGDEDNGEDVIIKIEKEGGNFINTKSDNVILLNREQKSQISLDDKGNGLFRLEFESDELEPIRIEVFDGEGNKLFKKKVKNFYGRFLKEIELSGNETGLYTVRVLQGDKEIIGEFEYK